MQRQKNKNKENNTLLYLLFYHVRKDMHSTLYLFRLLAVDQTEVVKDSGLVLAGSGTGLKFSQQILG